MHLFIASVALLGFLAATQAQDRRFSALAQLAGGTHRHAPHDETRDPASDDGFSGSFSARQTAKNLGY